MIDKDKLAGTITTASVYVRDFNQGDFMSINEDQKYTPEELMKVPLLITCIHKDEENSGFFEKQFSYAKAYHNEKNTNEKDAEIIKVGRKYTVKQLLEYMMIDGDNNAASLLYENIDLLSYQKTFTDLGLAAPDRVSMNFPISAKDYSLFMRTLYNATYLTIPNSEYATELLTKCKDKGGILIGMPVNEKMAHKFGECTSGTEKQLHESAIIYVNNYPYLITIMTKGNNIKNLSSVISKISSVVYKQIAAHN
jgi:beta-lactamase class A